ncbi:MAG TPA: AAA family ATPase [Desulfomonilaceae bacterium]|nr:AAA family ATPase [Desulfomonilaceae bacterium]
MAENQGLRSVLKDMVLAKTSLMYLVSDEDRRVEGEIRALASAFRPPLNVYVWSCTTGVTLNDESVLPNPSIMDALDWYMNIQETAFLIINDIHVFLKDNPPVLRKLKDTSKRIENGYKTIFMVSPMLEIPPEITSEVVLVDVPLPGTDEIDKLLTQVISKERHRDALMAAMTDDVRDQFLKGGAGLSSQQVVQAFRKALSGKPSVTPQDLDVLFEEKRQIVKKSGLLELFTQPMEFDQLGGFANLKKWLMMREDIFSKRAREYGLSFPKGVLMMGISGCGKSLGVKAIAAFWRLPLLRLDMGRIYDGIQGSPEECLRKVIKTSEASAPCVLWIDEIEAGIANAGQKSLGGSASRILATFLTWMQEKTSPVFIGATANNIELLPPEILRKGRFDELFYVELPSDNDRMEIIRIHLDKRGVALNKFDYTPLVKITEGFNGAEIEQGVVGALFRAFSEKREISQSDMHIALESIVPLSTTMKEQIKILERWAFNRAVRAGG